MNRLVGGQKTLAGELLRDRAGSLSCAPVTQVRQHGRGYANEVESAMVVEALVFNRDDGSDEVGRDLADGSVDPLLSEDGERQLIVDVVDDRRLVHLAQALDRGLGGQPGQQVRAPGRNQPSRQDPRQRKRRRGQPMVASHPTSHPRGEAGQEHARSGHLISICATASATRGPVGPCGDYWHFGSTQRP